MKRLLLAFTLGACATTQKPAPAAEVVAPEPPPKPWVRQPVPDPLPPIARTRPPVRTLTLKNGLKVVVVEDHRTRLVQTRLFLPTGSAGDHEELAGATYFALALLGDTYDERDANDRPTRPMENSARTLAMMAGAQLRFDVLPDSSWIGIDGYSVDANAILRRLDAVVTERRHGDRSFEGRAQMVIDLINELELTDGQVLEQYLTQLAFGAGHPYARPVFGTPTSIVRIGMEDIVERQRQLLSPVGATLLIAGDVKPDDIFPRARAAFDDWEGTAAEPVDLPPAAVSKRRSVTFLPRRPSRNTLICLARPLSDVKASSAALSLLVSVLGEARMSAVLREKLGLTYSVTSAVVERRAARAMLVCSRVKAVETTNATRVMLEELAALATRPPSTFELETARAMALTSVDTEQDDLSGIVAAWGHAAVMRKPAPAENEADELRKVTVDDLAAIAKKLAVTDTAQFIFSGERGLVDAAARANSLGPLKVPVLGRVAE